MNPEPLVERMRGFGTTIFAEMSALAVQTDSVNLGQGFPDTDGPAALLDDAVEAIRTGHNQYPPGPGIPALRAAVARHQREQYALDWDPDTDVLVTAGATEAIAAAVLALAEPGSDVVVFEPFYDSYPAAIALAGATRRPVTLRPRADGTWRFDADELAAAITARTRVLLLNTPHNPTGKVFDADELRVIAELACAHDLLVIADEVYEHLTFDGVEHTPIATLPGMRERTVTIGSAGKTFSVTGWKIGWASAPADLVRAVRAVKQFLTYVNGAPFQPAVARALEAKNWQALAPQLQLQRDLLCDGLTELGFDVLRPQATYFATVDVHRNGVEFCHRLPHTAAVVAIPSGVFYDSAAGDTLVRFAFCKRPEVLREALLRLDKSGAARRLVGEE